MAGIIKWLDHWLKQIFHQVPTYLKDSSQLVQLLTDQGTLPPGATIFTGNIIFQENIRYLRTKIVINY